MPVASKAGAAIRTEKKMGDLMAKFCGEETELVVVEDDDDVDDAVAEGEEDEPFCHRILPVEVDALRETCTL